MSTTKRRAIPIIHISTFQFTFKCGYNDFISKYTDINSLHVTQIDLLHNDTFCSTQFAHFRCKKGSLCVNSVMILVVLSTHAELASPTARGRSYWETGELKFSDVNFKFRLKQSYNQGVLMYEAIIAIAYNFMILLC